MISKILQELKEGKLTVEEAEKKLKLWKMKELGKTCKLDLCRELRTGVPEVVYAENKEVQEVSDILTTLAKANGIAMATKVKREDFVGILAAGTSDVPVAEEARVTCEVLGCETIYAYDVGVAGIHRLFEPLRNMIDKVCVIIVAAGMEGVLPTIVKSLVDVPVIGVPTSVGYGIGKDGVAALMTMLNSCSPGLAVVNIDNGFGAGVFASLIAKTMWRMGKS
jgi:hypothetical protein